VKIVSRKIESGDFSLNLQSTLFQPVTGVSFRASGPLSLKISHDQGEVAGRLSIRDGVYRRHLDAKADALKLFESSRLDLGASTEDVPSWKRWKLNIDINSETPVLVRNNLVDGNLNLHLRTVGTFQSPRLQGNMTIVNGQFYYVNRQFTVRSGSIQFTDPTSNIPVFDIRADTEISDSNELYRVYLRILGSADNQKISYSSDPTLSEKDILSLVVSGFRASNPTSVTQDPTKSAYYSGISFVTGQFQDRIERGLGTGLGIRRFGLSPSFSDTTKSTELQLTVGTDLIRNKLEVNYSNLLSTRGGHKVELELKMNRIVSLIGSWRNIEGGTDQDFGGDLRFRFEFE
jgi:autotransporter translocation and assembly factor TamB